MKVYLVPLFLLQPRIVYSSGVKKKRVIAGLMVSTMTLPPFEEGGQLCLHLRAAGFKTKVFLVKSELYLVKALNYHLRKGASALGDRGVIKRV